MMLELIHIAKSFTVGVELFFQFLSQHMPGFLFGFVFTPPAINT